jgi:hypothetical protein
VGAPSGPRRRRRSWGTWPPNLSLARRPALLLLALICGVLLAGCAGPGARAQADQDRDGRALADALRAADGQGGGFNMTEDLVLTGGGIPQGQEERLHMTVSNGALKDGTGKFTFRVQQARNQADFDMLIADERLYSKPHSSSAWRFAPISSVGVLVLPLRLELLRETVLLASSVSSSSLTHVDAGFARKYAVKPAPDQLEQLAAVSVQGAAEAQFLKTATAEIDVFLLTPGSKLGRVEVHVGGTDPSDGSRQQIDGSVDLRSARASTVHPPADAQAVGPSGILGGP